jgi:alpha-D-ribose 1-methylphosphonate 5-triphosphate synthase subunit PhnL
VFVADYPVLLLDEPTASLDATSRLAIVELIREARRRGAAVLGIVHDAQVRSAVASRIRTLVGTEAA